MKVNDIAKALRALADEKDYHSEPDENVYTIKLLRQAADEIERLKAKISDMGWQLNPDRMGG